jgi:hypothetical protein
MPDSDFLWSVPDNNESFSLLPAVLFFSKDTLVDVLASFFNFKLQVPDLVPCTTSVLDLVAPTHSCDVVTSSLGLLSDRLRMSLRCFLKQLPYNGFMLKSPIILSVRQPVFNTKKSNVDVSCESSTWHTTIVLQQDSTLIVLIYHIVLNIISLSFQEILSPHHQRHHINDSD